jgi:2-oxoglutarate dehydrogenase E2 component (dihydrolipoamide succinyltransferase)
VREGTISVWHKQVGDEVRTEEPLFEVETDKVTMDIPAPAAGVLAQILVPVGALVEVGARLAVIRVAGEPVTAEASPASPGARSSTTVATKTSASRGLNPTGGSSRATNTSPAASGRSASPSPAASGRSVTASPGGTRGANPETRLSPVVRKLLAEHRIDDPSVIAGTGADGRVTRDDVLAYVERRRGAAPTPNLAAPANDHDAPLEAGADTVIAMTRIRKLTAEHMVRSVATSPHVLQAVEVDFLAVERLRAAAGDAWKAREGFSLSYLPFVARAVCKAVPEFPHVNASVRGDALVVHHRVNLGIAVDLDRQGLIVPVVKDAASKTVRELAVAIHRLADRARRGALTPDELTEGTYTLSNSGPFGTLITAPIIYQPQVAILSTDGVRKRPVVIEGAGGDTIAIRPVGVLAQCFDHRAFDGAYSAAFLRRVREILEQADFGTELA